MLFGPDGGTVGGGFGLSKRAMSQTNVHGPARTWNLRSQHQGSESDLAFKRVTSVSSPIGRSTYSAHRERLKQEREQELLLQQQRQRQIAASSTGLNEAHLHQQNRSQQQYRSLSAVNTGGGSEAVEEIETIILQPIGRGVQDIDSRVGSMTTLPRGPGGSMMDGRVLQTYSPKMLPPRLPAVPRPGTSPVLPSMSWRTRSASPPLPTGHQLSSVGSLARHSSRVAAPFLSKTLTYRDNPYKSLPSSTPTPTKGSIAIRDSFAVHPVGPQETFDLTGPDKLATPTRRSPSVGSTSVQPYRSVQLHTVSQPVPQNSKDDSEFAILGTKTIRSELNTQTTPSPKIPVSSFDEDNLLKGDELMRKSLEELEKIQNEILDPELGDSRLHRVDDNPRTGLTKRGFSSTQPENVERDVPYLTRQPSNSDLIRPTAIHHSQTMIAPIVTSQPLQAARVDTSSTLVNNAQNGQFTGSRGQLSTTSSTIVAPATSSTVIVTPTNNGWKPEPVKRNGAELVDLTQVQETAPVWYRPNLSRETAISILRQQPPGSFLIRDSTTFKGAFGLAVKVATLPPKVTPKSGKRQNLNAYFQLITKKLPVKH
ncbi:hypothetical protein PHET_01859 [Paragonimus heterotremus]|uniref:SH2 domain-containing protein n=1 Tax=Paragonimus heterotremus TaxID=100268 RepID=A0A8J4X2W2_9TREM|nr:hypothetical protein PHET_01859 [Paragonimus heterotremus]